MICRSGAEFLEKGTPVPMGSKVSGPSGRILPCEFAHGSNIVGESFELGVDDGIWPVGRDHPSGPAAFPYHAVPAQVIDRAVGGGECFDVEAFEQRTGAVGLLREAIVNLVVNLVSGGRRQTLGNAKDLLQRMIDPNARRCGAE